MKAGKFQKLQIMKSKVTNLPISFRFCNGTHLLQHKNQTEIIKILQEKPENW